MAHLSDKVADICNVDSNLHVAFRQLAGAQGIIHISTTCSVKHTCSAHVHCAIDLDCHTA